MTRHLTLALAVFAALATTNPKQNDHANRLIDHARQGCAENPLGKLLCGGIAALSAPSIEYADYLVFSIARLGDAETVGAFGHVFVVRG